MRFLLLTLFYPLYMNAQQEFPKNVDGKIEYTDVVQLDSLVSAPKLLESAKIFITKIFESGKDVTQFVDERNNSIMGKGWMPVTVAIFIGAPIKAEVWFTVTIQCKDGRYKYSIMDFTFKYRPGTSVPVQENFLEEEKPKGLTKKQWQSVRDQVKDNTALMINNLKKQMQVSSSDW